MGRWPATVSFPDGRRLFAVYSSSIDTLLEDLHPRPVDPHTVSDDWEPEPRWRDAPLSPIDELVPVVIAAEPHDDRWHSLYCPRRAMVVGPGSYHHMMMLPEYFELVAGPDGVRHLRTAIPRDTTAACGTPAPGGALPFHRAPHYSAMPGPPEPWPPLIDLFADWSTGENCRRCLLATL